MIRKATSATLLALLVVGCATKGDVAKLRTTIYSELEIGRAQQDSLLHEIRQLRGVLLDSLGVQQRRDITGRVDLQRQIENLNVQLSQLIQLTGEMQRRSVEADALDRRPITSPDDGLSTDPMEGQDDSPTAGTVTDPAGLYATAIRQFRRESYGTAQTAFEEFLQRYPAHALAPDAQYFLAETYDRTGENEYALMGYARVLELFPNSRRAPAAIYKSGLLELRRGNTDDARTFFTRVVQGFPDSDEAIPAREELSRLGG